MVKRAFFHGQSGLLDNCDISGSFYESAPLKIQWILKEAWGANATAVSNFCYNDWWRWDNCGTKNARNVQRFTRLISYCLMQTNINKEPMLPSSKRDQNNQEKGYDFGPFKSALKQTSVVNIIENPTTCSTTTDTRLTKAWNSEKMNIYDTIKVANPDVLVICIKLSLFSKWVTNFPSSVHVISNKKSLYLEDSSNKRFVVVMRHPGQGFSYDNADEIINEYCIWCGI